MKTVAEAGAQLRALRQAAGLLQKDLAHEAGCSRCYVSELESGKTSPSLALAESLAANVGSSVADIWWPPRPCACGCGELTLGKRVEHHAAGSVTAALHREQLEKYLCRYGRRDTKRAAVELGCSEGTVRNYVRDHPKLGSRYPRPWSGEKPWTFGNRDLERMRRLLVENKQAVIDKTRAKRRRGEIDWPRRSPATILVACSCGCGKSFYRSPSKQKSKSGRYFYSRSCHLRARWNMKTSRDREMVRELVGGLEEWWGGRARQRHKGRLGGLEAPKGGRPRVSVTNEQKDEIAKLRDLGWGRRAIANRVLAGERAVRLTLAELDDS
jgi:transcriptional regulator with XRE-family HTH domain